MNNEHWTTKGNRSEREAEGKENAPPLSFIQENNNNFYSQNSSGSGSGARIVRSRLYVIQNNSENIRFYHSTKLKGENELPRMF
jgi:hypothetical protein